MLNTENFRFAKSHESGDPNDRAQQRGRALARHS